MVAQAKGERSARESREVVSAEFGPLSLGLVKEDLTALQTADMVNLLK